MNVLLINPPVHRMLLTNVLKTVDDTTGSYPPVGLLYIAASVQRRTSHRISVIDADAEKLDYALLGRRIKEFGPEVIGITATTFTLLDVLQTARMAKMTDPSIHVCLGGPHPNLYPEETIESGGIDSLVLGEGEYVFVELLEALSAKRDISKIHNVVCRKDNTVIVNKKPGCFIEDLDTLPFPARQTLPLQKYYSVLSKKLPMTTMITSRGCPYGCIFCDRPHLGKKFRARSARNVVDEFKSCVHMGIREIFIYDDTFTVSKQRVMDICSEILRRGIDISWDIRARVDTVDTEMLQALKKAGCIRIHYGIEAGTQEIVDVLKKNIDLNKARTMIDISRSMGFITLAYFMIGNPGETKDQILKTIQFAVELNTDYAHFSITTPFPGTELYRQGLKKNLWHEDRWRMFAQNPRQGFIPPVWEENLSRDSLLALLRTAYKSYYTRPRYIFKELRRTGSFRELKRKICAGIKLLFS